MSAEAWPTEAAATAAVDAAARSRWARVKAAAERRYADQGVTNIHLASWEELTAAEKLGQREAALADVWAALEAIPDPRHGAWAEGYAAGSSDAAFESEGHGTPDIVYPHENPYPSGL